MHVSGMDHTGQFNDRNNINDSDNDPEQTVVRQTFLPYEASYEEPDDDRDLPRHPGNYSSLANNDISMEANDTQLNASFDFSLPTFDASLVSVLNN